MVTLEEEEEEVDETERMANRRGSQSPNFLFPLVGLTQHLEEYGMHALGREGHQNKRGGLPSSSMDDG